MVRRSGRPARIEDYERARGPIADLARAVEWNVRSAVGAPIVVDGRLWGVIIASWGEERSPPDDTEERMVKFAQLLDTAIANADGRDQLMASRARLLTAGDDARRRVVRDLHDGAQQRLVHTVVTQPGSPSEPSGKNSGEVETLLGEALDHAEQGNRELRDLAHGILPSALDARRPARGRRSGRGAARPPRSRSTCRTSGIRQRSRRAPTSSWPRRSRTSSGTHTPDTQRSSAWVQNGTAAARNPRRRQRRCRSRRPRAGRDGATG